MPLRFPYRVIAALGLAVGCGGTTFSPGEPDGGNAAASGAAGTKVDAGTGATGGVAGGGGTSGAGGSSGGSGGASGSSTGGAGGGGAGGTAAGGTSGAGGISGAGGSSGTGGASGSGGSSATGGASGVGGTGTGGSGGGPGTGGAGTGGFDGGGSGAGGSGTGGSGTGDSGTGDGGVDWGACAGPGACVAVLKGCCGPCGMPEVDAFAGVNAAHVAVFKAETCPVPMPCPKCPTIDNPNIAARCVNSRCEAFDVRKVPEYSACAFDGDCRLRGGLACCERCSSDGPWVAVSVSSTPTLNAALCVPNTACPPCVPVPPAGMRAVCSTGRCAVEPPCSLVPRTGCCFSDTDCTGGQCYAMTCTAGSEGMCKARANQNECWGDRDCGPGKSCKGFSICPCAVTCIAPDKPGVCG